MNTNRKQSLMLAVCIVIALLTSPTEGIAKMKWKKSSGQWTLNNKYTMWTATLMIPENVRHRFRVTSYQVLDGNLRLIGGPDEFPPGGKTVKFPIFNSQFKGNTKIIRVMLECGGEPPQWSEDFDFLNPQTHSDFLNTLEDSEVLKPPMVVGRARRRRRVSGLAESHQKNQSLAVGLILGLALGGIALSILMLIGFMICITKMRRKRRRNRFHQRDPVMVQGQVYQGQNYQDPQFQV